MGTINLQKQQQQLDSASNDSAGSVAVLQTQIEQEFVQLQWTTHCACDWASDSVRLELAKKQRDGLTN